jgi:hypothetical protein
MELQLLVVHEEVLEELLEDLVEDRLAATQVDTLQQKVIVEDLLRPCHGTQEDPLQVEVEEVLEGQHQAQMQVAVVVLDALFQVFQDLLFLQEFLPR